MQKKKFIIEISAECQRETAVNALYVENENVLYYSCNTKAGKYVVIKCNDEGQVEFVLSGFHLVRGIGKDSEGNYYVADAGFGQVLLKFNNEWKALKRTSNEAARLVAQSYELFVEEERLFLCSENRICILNTNLDVQRTLCLGSYNATDITKFNGQYFVTTDMEIIVFRGTDIENSKFKAYAHKSFLMPDGRHEKFKTLCKLRGICTSEKKLYVTECGMSGSLLCLNYQNDRLTFTHKIKDSEICYEDCAKECSPVVLYYCDAKIYYSKGFPNANCHIVQVREGETNATRLFDV